MGICRYCGESAGWFTEVHEACLIASRAGCELIASVVASAVNDKLIPPTGETRPQWEGDWCSKIAAEVCVDAQKAIDRITAQNRVPPDAAHQAIVQGWSAGAERVAFAEPVAPGRLAAMTCFYRALGLSEQEIWRTDGHVAMGCSTILWSVMVSGSPISEAVGNHPFNLRGGEVPLFYLGSVVYSRETVSRSYQGGYGGMSVRVGHGMYYHFGGFRGQRIETAALQEIDYGGMLLTTQNIYFGGQHTNFRVPYEHVISFRTQADGIGVFRDTANAKAEVFAVLEAGPDGKPVSARPVFGWFLFNLAHFLAQPEARVLYAAGAHG